MTPIHAFTNHYVVAQHADEAAFLWTQRCRAVGAPHYSLRDLSDLDERVEAHLAGLRLAGADGWDLCQRLLAEEAAAGVFTAAQVAFTAGRHEWMLAALKAGCAGPAGFRGLISALGWSEYAVVAPWVQRLIEARNPLHRAAGIAALAMHGEDPGHVLQPSMTDPNSLLRGRAVRAAGELKRVDLVPVLVSRLDDPDASCRFWAAWSLALLGQPVATGHLAQYLHPSRPFAIRALQILLRSDEPERSRARVGALVRAADTLRLGVMGVGIVGDPVSVPWLIATMETPALARVAGEALTMITGVDLAYRDLVLKPASGTGDGEDATSVEPETPAETQRDDYDANLPRPSPPAIQAWWQEHGRAFAAGTRHLAGKPVSADAARQLLVRGKQRQRAAASLELACMGTDFPLFDVRSRGTRQQEQLAAWNSRT